MLENEKERCGFLFKSYEDEAQVAFVFDVAKENFLNEQAFVMAPDQRECRQRSKFVCLKNSLCVCSSDF